MPISPPFPPTHKRTKIRTRTQFRIRTRTRRRGTRPTAHNRSSTSKLVEQTAIEPASGRARRNVAPQRRRQSQPGGRARVRARGRSYTWRRARSSRRTCLTRWQRRCLRPRRTLFCCSRRRRVTRQRMSRAHSRFILTIEKGSLGALRIVCV